MICPLSLFKICYFSFNFAFAFVVRVSNVYCVPVITSYWLLVIIYSNMFTIPKSHPKPSNSRHWIRFCQLLEKERKWEKGLPINEARRNSSVFRCLRNENQRKLPQRPKFSGRKFRQIFLVIERSSWWQSQ